jgi:hypothetical protein
MITSYSSMEISKKTLDVKGRHLRRARRVRRILFEVRNYFKQAKIPKNLNTSTSYIVYKYAH